MTRPRAADDFAAIRARVDELRRASAARPRAADDFATIRARRDELRRERGGAAVAPEPTSLQTQAGNNFSGVPE